MRLERWAPQPQSLSPLPPMSTHLPHIYMYVYNVIPNSDQSESSVTWGCLWGLKWGRRCDLTWIMRSHLNLFELGLGLEWGPELCTFHRCPCVGPEGHNLRLSRDCREPRALALLAIASFLVGAWGSRTWGGQGSALSVLATCCHRRRGRW